MLLSSKDVANQFTSDILENSATDDSKNVENKELLWGHIFFMISCAVFYVFSSSSGLLLIPLSMLLCTVLMNCRTDRNHPTLPSNVVPITGTEIMTSWSKQKKGKYSSFRCLLRVCFYLLRLAEHHSKFKTSRGY